MKNNKFGILALFLIALLPIQVMATEVPTMIVEYKNVIETIITQVIIGLVILIMFVYSAWEAYQNANARPFKWALFASIIMGTAVWFGPSILEYATTNFGDLENAGTSFIETPSTGTSSVETSS